MKNKDLQDVKFTAFRNTVSDLKTVLLRNIRRKDGLNARCRALTSPGGKTKMMKIRFALAILAGALHFAAAHAQPPAEVTLTRIECGTGAAPITVERWSDTDAYGKEFKLTFTFSCYLVRHGSEYMVWDTGFAPGTNPSAPKVGIVERLKEVGVTPDQVKCTWA